MNTKSSIFMSGKAQVENTTFGIQELNKKLDLILKKSNFLFLLCLELHLNSLFQCVSYLDRDHFFRFEFDASRVLTWYDIGCKHSL